MDFENVSPLEIRSRSKSISRLEMLRKDSDLGKHMSRFQVGPFPRRKSSKCIHSLKYDSAWAGGDQNHSLDSQDYVKIMGPMGRSKSVFKFDDHIHRGFKAEAKNGMDFGGRRYGASYIKSKPSKKPPIDGDEVLTKSNSRTPAALKKKKSKIND